MLLHLTSRRAWDAAQVAGLLAPPSLTDEGFVHLSTPSQVAESADRHCRGMTDLVLLCIDPERLTAPLRWELAPARGQDFPHLYGPLNVDAVVAVLDFPQGEDGFVLPTLPCLAEDRAPQASDG